MSRRVLPATSVVGWRRVKTTEILRKADGTAHYALTYCRSSDGASVAQFIPPLAPILASQR